MIRNFGEVRCPDRPEKSAIGRFRPITTRTSYLFLRGSSRSSIWSLTAGSNATASGQKVLPGYRRVLLKAD
jgi:hypothetical protein